MRVSSDVNAFCSDNAQECCGLLNDVGYDKFKQHNSVYKNKRKIPEKYTALQCIILLYKSL